MGAVNLSYLSLYLVLALGGIINSGYLFWNHRQKKPLVCPLDHDCSVVTESKWSHLFGIRNEILGLLFFVGMLSLGLTSLTTLLPLPTVLLFILIGASLGLLFSLFLILLQSFVIKNYCFYCLISAGISTLLFVMSILLFRNV